MRLKIAINLMTCFATYVVFFFIIFCIDPELLTLSCCIMISGPIVLVFVASRNNPVEMASLEQGLVELPDKISPFEVNPLFEMGKLIIAAKQPLPLRLWNLICLFLFFPGLFLIFKIIRLTRGVNNKG